jgi:hypothetical protein
MLVASELPLLAPSASTSPGSVIAYADRMRPSSSGTSHLAFCSLFPYRAKTSQFPVSGLVVFVAWAASSM